MNSIFAFYDISPLPEKDISKYRKLIHATITKDVSTAHFTSLTPKMLEHLFKLYDRYFFNRKISKLIDGDKRCSLKFIVNKKDKKTTTAGIAEMEWDNRSCNMVMKFPQSLYLKIFNKDINERYRVNGVMCSDRLQCLQYVFEHELTHLLMYMYEWYNKVEIPVHGDEYKSLVKKLFGHTKIKHSLLAGDARLELKDSEIKLGKRVSFKQDTKLLKGEIVELKGDKTIVKVGKNTYTVPKSNLRKVK
jgi:hypothetical protein